MNEEWRDVVGFEGCYQVSNKGRVKSLPRYVRGRYSPRLIKGRYLSQGGTARYPYVTLCLDTEETYVYVHRLVGYHFVSGKTPDRSDINHIDGDKTNNVYTNLEWVTRKENIHHAQAIGLRRKA